MIVKASAVGAFDSLLESAILDARSPGSATVFWDVHPSATLAWLRRMPGDPLLECLPRYDLVITTGGGNDAVRAYLVLGARRCAEICGAVDPSTHRPLLGQMRFASDLTFLGNRRSRQLARVRELFLGAAALLRRMRFLLAGAGWNQEVVPANVKVLEPVSALEESALYCSARAVLDVSGEAKYARNVAPSSRLFEAAGSGACIIADAWDGIERFFEPGREILVAASPDQVADHMRGLSVGRARAIGRAALTRALSEHTFERRVNHLERLLDIDSGSALAAYTA